MKQIDLNCDLGESYGKSCSRDDEIMPFISSCNIACGFHSGDPSTIQSTTELALEHEVSVGAHPAFPDLQGFGRREMKMPVSDINAMVRYQVSALKGMIEALGGRLNHVKPHGALYNLAARDLKTAQSITDAVAAVAPEALFFGLAASVMERAAGQSGLRYASEVFADRVYEEDLQLRSRSFTDAVIHNEQKVLEQVRMLVLEGQVKTHGGQTKVIKADTLCLHSDTPGAVELARKIHEFLKEHDVRIAAPE